MRYKIWDSGTLEIYDRAGLTHQQRTLVESLLRSFEVGTYLSEHVSTASSAVLALTRAHYALDSNARVNQPQIGLTRTILSWALSDLASGVSAYKTTSMGAAAIMQAQQTLVQTNTILAGAPSSADKQLLANQISALVQPMVRAVRSLFEALWSGVNLSVEVASRICDEVAVLVALEGRDGRTLQIDFLLLLSRGAADANTVADILWPARKRYLIVAVVSGTRVLEDLDQLLPGARQWPLIGPNPPAGIPYRDTKGLIDPVLANRGSSVLITMPTLASDPDTAIAQVRRDIAETLDQYAAGQRLLELAVDPRAVALSANDSPTMSDPRIGGGKVARPLTNHWPTPLRSALRMANLSGRMDAPGQALCWLGAPSNR